MADVKAALGSPEMRMEGVDPQQTVARVMRRLVPFLVLVFGMNMLNRVNLGFAALQMNHALGLTATAFGIAGSCYWIGSVVSEVPGTIALGRWGARRVLTVILIAWGAIACSTGFVHSAHGLFVCRLALGLAEGCGQPGILLYLTYWIPESHRARVISRVFLCLPISNILASPISAVIMQNLHGVWHFAGWRWMFVLEGFPSIIIGLIAFYYLTDFPKEARWLSEPQREWLQQTIEKGQHGPRQHESLLSGFSNPLCYVFAFGWFGIAFFMSAITMFLPLVVRQLGYRNIYHIAMIAAIPFAAGLIAMVLWGNHADKTKERMWHSAIAALVGGLGWLLAYWMHSPVLIIASITLATAGMYATQGVFWALPPAVFSKKTMAVGLSLIAALGQFGGLIAPIIFGRIRDVMGSYNAAYLTVTVAMILTASSSLVGTLWGRARKAREQAMAAASAC